MIQAILHENPNGNLYGFTVKGHAESVPEGEYDLICAAVSMLTHNIVHGLEALSPDEVIYHVGDDGFLDAYVPEAKAGNASEETALLLDLLQLGLHDLEEQYRSFIRVRRHSLL